MSPSHYLRLNLLQRAIPAVQTPEGLRAVSKDRPITPESVERYLEQKFGEVVDEARKAMTLARSMPPSDLASRAFELYESFRPAVFAGTAGWGASGVLDLERIRSLTKV